MVSNIFSTSVKLNNGVRWMRREAKRCGEGEESGGGGGGGWRPDAMLSILFVI